MSGTQPPLKYGILIYWSPNDDAFIAEAPELPGCAADGPTPQEALANLQVVAGSGWRRRGNSAGRCPSRAGGCCSPDRPALVSRPSRVRQDERTTWREVPLTFGPRGH